MDSIFFTAYNNCDLVTQGNIYSDSIEFYHDKGGLNTSKKEILESTHKNICGQVTRQLVKGSMEVYPIKDYGAVEMGFHTFHKISGPEAGDTSAPDRFIVIWKKQSNGWKITRVISLH
ncbi:nuclear transport factor 2 family protein [Deminuibacter soli]|uniref:Nuclear transport factor 2 family protein n=2 Tax=Deminuibacter soli TaxID=2291815 RepID=A0A3E1NCD4_9BACT|nr:nuclear transport factor 2 family protein [Deminuibacter soli]